MVGVTETGGEDHVGAHLGEWQARLLGSQQPYRNQCDLLHPKWQVITSPNCQSGAVHARVIQARWG